MRKIYFSGKLGMGKFTMVDDEDYERLHRFRWYPRKSGESWYVERQQYLGRIDGKPKVRSIKMHREIMGLLNSPLQVDHKDQDTLNNQKYNLRSCTQSQNNHNQGLNKRNSTGYKNITVRKNRFVVIFNYNKTPYWVGSYILLPDAIEARDKARINILGEFA